MTEEQKDLLKRIIANWPNKTTTEKQRILMNYPNIVDELVKAARQDEREKAAGIAKNHGDCCRNSKTGLSCQQLIYQKILNQ